MADPKLYLYDSILSVPIVQQMPRGHLLRRLVEIYVEGTQEQFDAFFTENSQALAAQRLAHEHGQHKIRMMTLLRICQGVDEVTFGRLESELKIPRDKVQDIIVEALRSRLVCGKVDERLGLLKVMSSEVPQFGAENWRELLTDLHTCKSQVTQLIRLMMTVSSVEAE